MRFPRLSLLLFFLPALLVSHLAQAQAPVFKDYELIRYNNQLATQAVFQCSQGYLWFGTSEGLFRFDGMEKVQYTTEDSLAENSVTSIAQASNGSFWLGHGSGLISYGYPGNWAAFEPREGTPASAISDILVQDSVVWFATLGEGVYYYHNERLYILTTDEGMPDNYVYDLEQDKQGNVWLSTDGGIAKLSLNEEGKYDIAIFEYAQGLPDNIVKALTYDGKEAFWIGMQDGGLAKITISDGKITPIIEDWNYGPINDIVVSENTLWIATDRKGLVAYSLNGSQNVKVFNRNSGLNQVRVKALLEDKEGNLWLGTSTGVVRSPGKQVEFLRSLPNGEAFDVQALCTSANGDVWFSTSTALYKVSQQNENFGEVEQFLTEGMYADMSFISLYEDESGMLWLGTYGFGLVQFNPATQSARLFSEKDGLQSANILSITGKEGRLYLATLEGAVRVTLGSVPRFESFTKESGHLLTNFLYKVFVDSKNRVWFASDGKGLSVWEADTFTHYTDTLGLNAGVFYGIDEDAEGMLWFNSADKGVYVFDGKTFQTINTKNGLREDNSAALIHDGKNHMVLVSRLGIDIIHAANKRFKYLGEEVGFADIIPNLNAATRDASGNIWFGTQQGLVKYAPLSSEYSKKVVPLIQQVSLFGKPIAPEDEYSFPHFNNNFTFDYVGIWHTAADKVSYQIKLENYDNDWVNSKNRQVTYSSLPHGTYTFQVRASADNDFEQADIAQFTFTIRPPFYKTVWFYILVVLAGIAGFFGIVRARERSLRETQRELEKMVDERTLEIKQQNEELEAQRDQINEKNLSLESAFVEIAKKNENITSSINYAKRIQRAILPLEDQLSAHLPEHMVYYRPKDIVSGDFYWMSAKGSRIYLAAVDCTGHGVPGAFMSLIGNSLLNEIVDNNEGIEPHQVLNRMNDGVIRMLKQGDITDEARKSRDGMDLALICLDLAQGHIEFAGAKRSLICIDSNDLIEYKGDKFSIGGQGLFDKEVVYHTITIPLHHGQHFYIFTDGYADQFSGHNATKFMTKTFKEFLLEIHQLPMEEQQNKLGKKISAWMGNAHQTDDMLVIGLRITEDYLEQKKK
ncbi:two-component regulator propeller domain-containing protein [Cytophagales bacterium LB-30]|uniref:Two-component regulator propeller domain-containing protein n=1 Tax=Shiella aurantiaca TaxID=3058365 RepID=A0ABT8F806_9BACT|nr:two-component regulator propeller domain-containing protein [Shiella aurantiaca]MDN4166523.1 two-component regulator propeller domain-containing protein [Shiella aurantiaca]